MSHVLFWRGCVVTIVLLASAGALWAEGEYDFMLVNQYQQAGKQVFEYDLVITALGGQVTSPITDIHFRGPVIYPGGIIITPPEGWLLDEEIEYSGSYYIGNVSAGTPGNWITEEGTLHGWKFEGNTTQVEPGEVYLTQNGFQNGPAISRGLPVSTPEPATLALLTFGAMLGVRRRR